MDSGKYVSLVSDNGFCSTTPPPYFISAPVDTVVIDCLDFAFRSLT
jgi:hypothetical protein